MRLEHQFVVPVDVDRAWEVLLDVERIAPCLPGATLEKAEGDEFSGTVKVKVGPIALTYGGRARFVTTDPVARTVVLEASGRETRGPGTARANISASLVAQADDGGTRVDVVTDLTVTGRPAQFGRGVMADVGGRLIDQFAACLAQELSAPAMAAAPAAAATATPEPGPEQGPGTAGTGTGGPASPPVRPTAEPIDLLGVGGAVLGKRLGGVAAVAAAVALLAALARRRWHSGRR